MNKVIHVLIKHVFIPILFTLWLLSKTGDFRTSVNFSISSFHLLILSNAKRIGHTYFLDPDQEAGL